MKSDAISSVVLNALSAMTVVAMVAATGYSFALYPKKEPYLSTAALKHASIISNSICLPALIISSLGSSLSINLVSRMGVLILFSFYTSLISYTLGATLGKFIDQNVSNLYVPIYVAIGSPNIVSLPLMVLSTLCVQDIVSFEFNGSSGQCFSEASSMVFVYSIGWHLVYWSYGFPILKSLAKSDVVEPSSPKNLNHTLDNNFIRPKLKRKSSSLRESLQVAFFDFQHHLFKPHQLPSHLHLPQSEDTPPSASYWNQVCAPKYLHSWKAWCYAVLLSPIMVCIYVGTFIGLVEPLQTLIFGYSSPLRPIGSALTILGSPTVCVNSLIMSASLAKIELGINYNEIMNRLEAMLFGTRVCEGAVKIDNIETQTSPLHNTISSREFGSSYEAPTTHQATVSSSETSNQQQQKFSRVSFITNNEDKKSAQDATVEAETTARQPKQLDKPPHIRSVVALFVCRMILPPLFVLLFIQLSIAIGLLRGDESDRMLRLVVLLESSAPPAQILIVSLNQLTLPRVAGGMAYLYIFMYSLSILTITFWATVAIYTIY